MFEDMKRNLQTNVKRIADFLNRNVSDDVIDIITKRTTFENMKADNMLYPEKINNPTSTGKSERMRRGELGDWRRYFNEEQNEFIEQRYKETLQQLGLEFIFE